MNEPRAALTTMVRDELCPECAWPDTCAADRTCWLEEPDRHDFTGALQARALQAATKRGRNSG